MEFSSIDQLFDNNLTDRPKAIMQTFMYSLLFSKKINDEGISPQIFYLKDFYKPRINSNIEIKETKEANDLPIGILNNFRSIEDQFKTEFELCLSEIFDY